MNENYNDCHRRKTKRKFFYKQRGEKIAKRFYIKSQTLFKELDNSRYVFIYKTSYTLRYGVFHEIFVVGIFIQKASQSALRDVFYIQRAKNFAKTKTVCDTFLYTKIRHFALRNFSLNFKICGGGEYLFIKKICTLRDIFILVKKNALHCCIQRS